MIGEDCRVISIKSCWIDLLGFLFPDYCYVGVLGSVSSGFIVRYDIRSRSELELIKFRYSNCVIVSDVIFDELWDLERCCVEVLRFSRERLGSRRRKFACTDESSLVSDSVRFMFGYAVDVYKVKDWLLDLLSSVGSVGFVTKFLVYCDMYGFGLCRSVVMTFIGRVLRCDCSSKFYKVAFTRFGERFRRNVIESSRRYSLRCCSELSFCCFVLDMCK